MKKYITNAAKMLLTMAILVPIVSIAQEQPQTQTKQAQITEDEKFTYGTPSYFRPYSQNGIGVFETTKEDNNKPYEGKKNQVWCRLYHAVSEYQT
jgi:hypothetical protein